MKFILIIPLILILSSCGTNPKKAKKAQLYLQLGTSHLKKQNYPAALKDLQIAHQLDPKHSVINNNLGLAYFVRSKYHKALAHFKKAIAGDDNYTEARNNLGRTLTELGRYQQSIHVLEQAKRDLTYREPQKVYMNLGYTYYKMKRYQNAYANFSKSLKIDPNNCLLRNYFGKTLYYMSKYELSVRAFQQTLNTCGPKKLEEPYYYNALNYYKLGLFHQARSQVETLNNIFPEGNYAQRALKLIKIME